MDWPGWVVQAMTACLLFWLAPAWADDPCNDAREVVNGFVARGEVPKAIKSDPFSTWSVTPVRHADGTASLLRWQYGAAGRVECSYLVFRRPNEQLGAVQLQGHSRVVDLDGDGFDELLVLENLTWAMACSGSMAEMPHEIKVLSLNRKRSELVNVSGQFRAALYDHLQRLRDGYRSAEGSSPTGLSEPCDLNWKGLLQNTYEAAWRTLLIGAAVLTVLSFALGLSRSSSLRWIGRGIGALTTLGTVLLAFMSLGDLGWHIVGLSDFWSAFQVVTGFRFNPLAVEVISLLTTGYAGWAIAAK